MKDLNELIKLAEKNLKAKQKLLDSSMQKDKSHLQGFINNISSDIYNFKMTQNNAIKSSETYSNFKYEADKIIKQIEDLKI
jgi:hypothetical protein